MQLMPMHQSMNLGQRFTSVSVEMPDQGDSSFENPERITPEQRQQPFSFLGPDLFKLPKEERTIAIKRYLQTSRFNPAKLDQRRINGVIQELLSSRSADRLGRAAGYIIIGWFPRDSLNPREAMLTINDRMDLFG